MMGPHDTVTVLDEARKFTLFFICQYCARANHLFRDWHQGPDAAIGDACDHCGRVMDANDTIVVINLRKTHPLVLAKKIATPELFDATTL